MGRSPKNSLAADPDKAAAGAGGRPAPHGVKSPLDSSDVESAMKAWQVVVTDGESPLAERLAVLPTLGLEDLRREWRRLSRAEPPRLSRDIMMRAIAYRMQEIAQGGLSKVAQRRLMTLANQLETDGRIAPLPGPRIKSPRLAPDPGMAWPNPHGYHGHRRGFLEFQEPRPYRSLTQRSRSKITGAKWSGPRFFGLTQRPRSAAGGRKTAASKADSDGVGTNADNPAFQSENLHG